MMKEDPAPHRLIFRNTKLSQAGLVEGEGEDWFNRGPRRPQSSFPRTNGKGRQTTKRRK